MYPSMPYFIIKDCAGVNSAKLIYIIGLETETDVPTGKWSF